MEEGLKHVYIGNVPGHPLEHTYCPNCGYKLNIKGHYIGRSTGYPIPLMW
jgi:pyruvate formate lyase activating enzyme